MKYISIDLETTGLNHEEHKIIEFGAIIEDSNNPKSYKDSPKFRRVVLQRNGNYNFSSFAAKINANLIKLIADIESGAKILFEESNTLANGWCYEDKLILEFVNWLTWNEELYFFNRKGSVEIVAAGKNFGGFDKNFIKKLNAPILQIHHRTIDPTTPYIDWQSDSFPPSSDKCKERVGLSGEIKHEALADAWDVILLLREQYNKNPRILFL
jgi:oligoribonuclease